MIRFSIKAALLLAPMFVCTKSCLAIQLDSSLPNKEEQGQQYFLVRTTLPYSFVFGQLTNLFA